MNELDLVMSSPKDEEEILTVVRVKTEYYHSRNGIHQKRSITTLKRKSKGLDLLNEEVTQTGAEEAACNIENFNDVDDGVYRLGVSSYERDWETGVIDGWTLRLCPYKEENSDAK